jgi:hypothetical protein
MSLLDKYEELISEIEKLKNEVEVVKNISSSLLDEGFDENKINNWLDKKIREISNKNKNVYNSLIKKKNKLRSDLERNILFDKETESAELSNLIEKYKVFNNINDYHLSRNFGNDKLNLDEETKKKLLDLLGSETAD